MTNLFAVFLADFATQLAGLESAPQLADGSPGPERLRALGGDLFALRTGASLLGIGAVARAAGAAEQALLDGAAGLAWSAMRAPLTVCAAALDAAMVTLSRADASGARIDDPAPLLAAAAALEALRPARVEAPPPVARAPEAAEDDAAWRPQVDGDMIEPFLEEATERIEALSQKRSGWNRRRATASSCATSSAICTPSRAHRASSACGA